MTSQEFTTTIISAIMSSTLVVGILTWIFREWISTRLKAGIEHEYNQQLEIHKAKLKFESDTSMETHKAQLKSESDISIERLKSQLHIAASERNIQYSTVFEKQVDVISKTSELLQEFLEAAASYTSIINNVKGVERDAKRVATGEAYAEFLKFFRPRKMFIPKETVSLIDVLHIELHSKAFDFMFMVDQGNEQYVDPTRETWFKVHEFMTKEVLQIQERLEDDFRKILGTLTHES